MIKNKIPLIITLALLTYACSSSEIKIDPTAPIAGKHHFIDGYKPVLNDNFVQIVVEIPTGTTAKWEVNKDDGKLHWEIKNGKPRVIDYLGYPGNYGMIPRTLLSYESGGDGDPLDVLVLGPPIKRGTVIKAKIIGALKLLDGGEQDDKLIAVMEGNSFYKVNSISELEQSYPTIPPTIQTWFVSYKGPEKLTSTGYSDAQTANEILAAAIENYSAKN